jgi:hypothetical protein
VWVKVTLVPALVLPCSHKIVKRYLIFIDADAIGISLDACQVSKESVR